MSFKLGANSLHHLSCACSRSHQVTLPHTYRMFIDAGGGQGMTEILIRKAINSKGNKTSTLLAGSKYFSSFDFKCISVCCATDHNLIVNLSWHG